jgi:hypothetical protein
MQQPGQAHINVVIAMVLDVLRQVDNRIWLP